MKCQVKKVVLTFVLAFLIEIISWGSANPLETTNSTTEPMPPVGTEVSITSSSSAGSSPELPITLPSMPQETQTGTPDTFQAVVIRKTDIPATPPPPPQPDRTASGGALNTAATGTSSNTITVSTMTDGNTSMGHATPSRPNGNSVTASGGSSQDNALDPPASTGSTSKTTATPRVSGTSEGTFRDVIGSSKIKNTGSSNVENGAGSHNEIVLNSSSSSLDKVQSISNGKSNDLTSSSGGASTAFGSEGDGKSSGSDDNAGTRVAGCFASALAILMITVCATT